MTELHSGSAAAHTQDGFVLDLTGQEYHVYKTLVRMFQFSRETRASDIAQACRVIGTNDGFGGSYRIIAINLKSLIRKGYVKFIAGKNPEYKPLFDLDGRQLQPLLSELDQANDVPIYKCPTGYCHGYGLHYEKS